MKRSIKFLQFYIGNVCNLACPNCASFNNYAFKGQYSWEQNAEAANRWSEILDPTEVAIIGGEPFTNPDLDNWVKGLLSVFTPQDFRITTNGTFIERDIERILEYTRLGVNIEISSHSAEHYVSQNSFIEKHYPFKEVLDDAIVYKNGSKGFIEIRDATQFFNICIKEIKDNVFYMHNNDPALSHSACLVSDCHYIVEGKLYQCVVTATAPLFAQQFNVDEHSQQLLSTVKSVSPYDDETVIESFLNAINSPCSQCALCPSKITTESFVLPEKKVKL